MKVIQTINENIQIIKGITLLHMQNISSRKRNHKLGFKERWLKK
jgi:hypothetical protein